MEIVFGTLRSIDGLKNIKPENCCEYIVFCEDTIRYLEEREEASSSEENKILEELEDQIINLCTHGTELKSNTLRCCLRNKYSGAKNGA